MLLLNYTHPLTDEQRETLTTLLGQHPDIRDIPTHVDRNQPLTHVATALADDAGLSPHEWQTIPLLLNPPALSPVAIALLAELHGRCGYFVPILNVRPVAGVVPPRYEISEIIALQELRDTARQRRTPK
jgi:hypothetical protein